MPVLSNGTRVEVRVPPRPRATIPNGRRLAVVVRGPKGDRGLPGISGNFGFETAFPTPAAVWTIPVPPEFGRTPAVQVIVEGKAVIADVVADSTSVTVIHPEPISGSVILT